MREHRTGIGMLTRDEQVRCAHAAIALRPDWNLSQLKVVLEDERVKSRPFPHVAVALAYVAADEDTKAPGRLFTTGPWWDAARAKPNVTDSTPTPRRIENTDCRECFRPKADHGVDPTLADHDYAPWHSARSTPMPADTRAAINAALTPTTEENDA